MSSSSNQRPHRGGSFAEGAAFASSGCGSYGRGPFPLFDAFVVYCNRVGFEDGKAFARRVVYLRPSGSRLVKAREMEEELVLADLRLEDIRAVRKNRTFLRENRPEVVLRSLKGIIDAPED